MGEISRNGAKTALEKHYTNVNITIVNSLADLEALVSRSSDLVFLGMTFLPMNPELGWQDPDKIWVSDHLEKHGIAYTGSDQTASSLERNKDRAKQRVLDAGLRTSPFYVAKQGRTLKAADITLKYLLFIKPTNRGGGLGIDSQSIAHDFKHLQSKVLAIASELQSDSIIEEYLSGREFSVAILRKEHTDIFTAMSLELIAPANMDGARILSSEVKSQDTERFDVVSDTTINSNICNLALGVFHALGARDYGRIDIRLDGNGDAHFLEANLLPSLMDGYGNFPKACWLNEGISYESMLLAIVSMAMPTRIPVCKPEHSALVPAYQYT